MKLEFLHWKGHGNLPLNALGFASLRNLRCWGHSCPRCSFLQVASGKIEKTNQTDLYFLLHSRHRCAVSSYSTCFIKSNFHLRKHRSSPLWVRAVCGIASLENRDVRKLMYKLCCNGRPRELTHLRVQPLAPNAQRSLGHLPLAQKSKKPWADREGVRSGCGAGQ